MIWSFDILICKGEVGMSNLNFEETRKLLKQVYNMDTIGVYDDHMIKIVSNNTVTNFYDINKPLENRGIILGTNKDYSMNLYYITAEDDVCSEIFDSALISCMEEHADEDIAVSRIVCAKEDDNGDCGMIVSVYNE